MRNFKYISSKYISMVFMVFILKLEAVFFCSFHLLLIIGGPNDASNTSVVSLHRTDLLECDWAEDLDNVSMDSGEVMSSMRKAGLFASPDLEFLDNSKVVD